MPTTNRQNERKSNITELSISELVKEGNILLQQTEKRKKAAQPNSQAEQYKNAFYILKRKSDKWKQELITKCIKSKDWNNSIFTAFVKEVIKFAETTNTSN